MPNNVKIRALEDVTLDCDLEWRGAEIQAGYVVPQEWCPCLVFSVTDNRSFSLLYQKFSSG